MANTKQFLRYTLRDQTLRAEWVEPPGPDGQGLMRVVLVHPPRPSVLCIESGDTLIPEGGVGEAVYAAVFLPTRGRLVRGGLVLVD
jgi:hypothetical protein